MQPSFLMPDPSMHPVQADSLDMLHSGRLPEAVIKQATRVKALWQLICHVHVVDDLSMSQYFGKLCCCRRERVEKPSTDCHHHGDPTSWAYHTR